MPSGDSVERLGPRKSFHPPDRAAAAWSVGVHALLLAAAALVPWSRQLERAPEMQVVWVREWREAPPSPPAEPASTPPAAISEPPAISKPPAIPEQPPSGQEREKLEEQTQRTALTPPSEAREAPAERQAPPRAQAPDRALRARAAPKRAQARPSLEGQAPAPIPGHVDFDAERRLAFEQLRREQARFPTFSVDDLVHKPPPKEPNPYAHLYDGGGGGGGSGRSVLGVGQARTKVGRFVSNLCNALTGGFSVMGLMSVCARDTTGPYSASPLRPDYLKKRPVCEDTAPTLAAAAGRDATGDAVPADGATVAARAASANVARDTSASTSQDASASVTTRGGSAIAARDGPLLAARDDPPSATATASAAASTIKCRLLDEAQRAEYWKHFGERLSRDGPAE